MRVRNLNREKPEVVPTETDALRVDKSARLTWTGSGLAFDGGPPDGPQVMVDGGSAVGPSPMDFVLVGVAGCMAIDILDILKKGRVPLDGLEMLAEGQRADDPPKRYTRMRLVVTVRGVPSEDRPKVERAVSLSRDRYCSVLHTLRSDIPLEILVEGV